MKTKVAIDADLKEIIPGFLQNRRNDILTIQKHLSLNDFEVLRILGHTMKGAGASYGFEVIGKIGAAIETAAKEGDGQTIKLNTEALTLYLERLDIEYVIQ